MTRNEENAFCCGAGGGVRPAFPEQARQTAIDRIEEAASTGAAAVVSACPFCRSNLEDALTAEAQPMKYFDLTELIVRAL